MGKLGRMRKDTLRDIAIQRYKDAERESNTPSAVFEKDGNKVLIVSNYDSTCALCYGKIRIGNFIWFDSTKPPGSKVVHRDCYTPNVVE